MIRSYDEILLSRASDTLGRMLDHAAYSLHRDAASMMELFISCGLASLFENGDIRVIAGMSGIELAHETLERSGMASERAVPRHTISLSPEYWCGVALARAQWRSGLRFEQLLDFFPVSAFIADYAQKRVAFLDALPLDISDADRAEKIRAFGSQYAAEAAAAAVSGHGGGTADAPRDTSLKTIRMKNGLSQSQLANASGVPLRTIQQYEQRQKDINKARAEYIMMLSAALNCDPASLLEKKQG